MKKAYSKPMVYIEDFTLSETIASDCSVVTHSHHRGGCQYQDGKFKIFYQSGGCHDNGGNEVALLDNVDLQKQYHCTNGPAAGMVFSS